MASTYYEDRHGRPQLLHIDASAPYVNGPSGLSGGGRGLTDPLQWQNQFRRSDSQITRPELPGDQSQANQPQQAQPSITHQVLSEILPLNPFANSFSNNVSLNTGQGSNPTGLQFGAPPTHLDHWMANAGQFGKVNISPTGERSITSPYGQGYSSIGQGPRTPYIGGINGDATKDFVAGGKYSSAKAGSDPTLDPNFSFASAFR